MVDAVYTDFDKAFGKMLHGTLVQKVRAEKIVAENAKKNPLGRETDFTSQLQKLAAN